MIEEEKAISLSEAKRIVFMKKVFVNGSLTTDPNLEIGEEDTVVVQKRTRKKG